MKNLRRKIASLTAAMMMVMMFIIPLDNAGVSFKAFADMFEPVSYASEKSAVYVVPSGNEKNDYGVTCTCLGGGTITLVCPDDGIYNVGDTFNIEYVSSRSANSSLIWSSSNTGIASVDSLGKVTVNGFGKVTINARSTSICPDNNEISSYASVTFTISGQTTTTTAEYRTETMPVTTTITTGYQIETTQAITYTTPQAAYIYLNKPSKSDYCIGDTFFIDYTAWGDYSSIEWSSSDTSIASIDSSGKITVNGFGTVTITATAGLSYFSNHGSDSVTFTISALTSTTTTTTNSTTATTIITTAASLPTIKLSSQYSGYYYGEVYSTFSISYTASNYTSISWSSSNSSVASVSSSGKVTVYGSGSVTISATAKGAGGTATDSVTLDISAYTDTTITTTTITTTGYPDPIIQLSEPNESVLYVGNTFTLKYTSEHVDYVQWSSSDTDVASIDYDGLVTINGSGYVTISVYGYAYYGQSAYSSVSFYVYESPEIKLHQPDLSDLYVGNTFYLIDELNYYIEWSSSDESVASIDYDGLVTINGYGTVTISAIASNYSPITAVDSITFTVDENFGKIAIVPSRMILNPGDTNELLMINVPDDATVKWTSSNTKVATVSNGTVKATGQGTAFVYAIVNNVVYECPVIVSGGDYLAGDANGDGEVDMGDAVAILKYLADPVGCALSEQGKFNGDVNLKGNNLDSSDALAIQKLRAKQISTLPESYYR